MFSHEKSMLGLSAQELVIYVAYGLVAAGSFLLARTVLQEQETLAASESLQDLKNRQASNPHIKLLRPFFTQYVVPMVRGKAFWEKSRLKYRRKIITAGLKDEITADEFISFKAVLILFFPMVGGLLKAGGFVDFSTWIILGTGVAGWFYPDFMVSSRITARQKQIRKSMPFIVDLLALSTEAGLDFVGAMQKVVEKSPPSPLIDEFEQLLKEIRVGASRGEAMREMAGRVDMPEVGSFIAILISADQMGASIGKILRQQSEQVRMQRFVAAEKAGAAAASALMLPILFLVVPAVMIMIFAPIGLQLMAGGGDGGLVP